MFDSRSKIRTVAEGRVIADEFRAAGRPVRCVVGFFDPLLPDHIGALEQWAGESRVFVFVDTPDDVYLQPEARAALAASLRFVEVVMIGRPDEFAADENWDAREVEHEHRTRFLSFVRDRAKS